MGSFSFSSPMAGRRPRSSDNWALPPTGERKPSPFAQTAFNERNGQFSPDGRWIAYSSDESQRAEIYVALFNGPGGAPVGKRQISTAGGTYPRWRRDGKEIFYIAPDRRLMAAEVSVKGITLEVGAVHSPFVPVNGAASFQYDVSADGQRIFSPWWRPGGAGLGAVDAGAELDSHVEEITRFTSPQHPATRSSIEPIAARSPVAPARSQTLPAAAPQDCPRNIRYTG